MKSWISGLIASLVVLPAATWATAALGPSLVVVHPSAFFDANKVTEAPLMARLRQYRSKGATIVYLVHTSIPEEIQKYFKGVLPDDEVSSSNGENSLQFDVDEVAVAGGGFSQCLANAVASFSLNRKAGRPLRIDLLVDAIYDVDFDLDPLGNAVRLKEIVSRFNDAQLADFTLAHLGIQQSDGLAGMSTTPAHDVNTYLIEKQGRRLAEVRPDSAGSLAERGSVIVINYVIE